MQISIYSLLVILGCGLVTWLPRIIPFLMVRKMRIPQIILDFLSYVPLCILTALLVQSLMIYQPDRWPTLHYQYALAIIPTVISAIVTKNLMWIVIVGMVAMALIRLFLIYPE